MEGSGNGVSFGTNSLANGLNEGMVLRIIEDPDPCVCWAEVIDRHIFLGAIEQEAEKWSVVKVIVRMVESGGEEDEEPMWKVLSAVFADGDEEREVWDECQKG